MRTWSLTSFFNELDVLEIRLAELDPVVDVFVIAEASKTHSGDRKPLYFQENRERFAPWLDKIRHVVVKFPKLGGSWEREHYQRDQLREGLDGIELNDLIILSDVDEILRVDQVRQLHQGRIKVPVNFALPVHVYRLNWRWPSEHSFACVRVFRGKDAHKWSLQKNFERPVKSIQGECGWHFSYMGDAEAIALKIRSLADEWIKADPSWAEQEHVERSIRTGADLFGRPDRQATWVPDDRLPEYVQANRERFSHLLIPCPASSSPALRASSELISAGS